MTQNVTYCHRMEYALAAVAGVLVVALAGICIGLIGVVKILVAKVLDMGEFTQNERAAARRSNPLRTAPDPERQPETADDDDGGVDPFVPPQPRNLWSRMPEPPSSGD